MTDERIMEIAYGHSFKVAHDDAGEMAIHKESFDDFARDIEKEVQARANAAFLKVLHLVNNGSVKEASEIFMRELGK